MKGGDNMPNLKVGVVEHYYDKIGVAIVELSDPLALGDKIKIVKDDKEFEQTVESMQIEHEKIEVGKKGQAVGIKVNESVKEGAEVYKIS